MHPRGQARAAALAAAFLPHLLLTAACAAGRPPVAVGGGPSALPNLGLAAAAAVRLREGPRASAWIEAEVTQQCLDDADLTGKDYPAAGDWTQARAGLKLAFPAAAPREWTVRTGLVWLEARGRPNLVDDPGSYAGLYLDLGFETRLGEHLRAGPSLAVMGVAAERGGGRELVPQVAWRLLWTW
ncbi:MAG: hypothetical protein AB1726_06615 [Planctomycetota bacterium]